MQLDVSAWCAWCGDDLECRADAGGCVLDPITGEVWLYCERCWQQEHLQEFHEAQGYRDAREDELEEIERLMGAAS